MNKNQMILIPSSEFTMGSLTSPNEGPLRKVKLSSYYIDKYPVTNKDYKKFIDTGGYKKRKYWTDTGWEFIKKNGISFPLYWNNKNWNQPLQPVTGVSWWEACAYSNYVKKTLPTEAQWEFAAKGKSSYIFPWGNHKPTMLHANYAPNCEPSELLRSSTEVDKCPLGVSVSGCYDMAGNVGEWCLDNSSLSYDWDKAEIDPCFFIGEEYEHIVRGGSGLHDEDYLRCSSRDYYPPSLRDNIVGIRCVINGIKL